METLNNDTFFQSFVEEFADKQVLLINKNKKNIVICYDLWECIERGNYGAKYRGEVPCFAHSGEFA
jgi:hypothetical protein